MKKIDTPEFENLTPEEKEQILLKKKRAFIKKAVIAAIIVFAAIPILVLAVKIRKEAIADRVRFKTNPPVEAPSVIDNAEETAREKEYTNVNLQLSLKYPGEATLTDSFDTALGEGKVEIKYVKDNDPDFAQGYIVTVTVFSTKIRDLNQFALTKMQAMKETCPDTASYSKIYGGKMGEYSSLNYTIDYCAGYYRNYYIDYGGKFFEVSRYYKGDVGYRQQYETETLAITNSIKFLAENFVPEELIKYVTDEATGISFEYPSNMVTNCAIPMPTDEKYRPILSMCNEGDIESGVIVGVISLAKTRTYESFIESEKSKMYDDFFAAKGYTPEGKEEVIDFNGKTATRLSGYHWKGTDYIYTTITGSKTVTVAIVGVKESDALRIKIPEILDSFTFQR